MKRMMDGERKTRPSAERTTPLEDAMIRLVFGELGDSPNRAGVAKMAAALVKVTTTFWDMFVSSPLPSEDEADEKAFLASMKACYRDVRTTTRAKAAKRAQGAGEN